MIRLLLLFFFLSTSLHLAAQKESLNSYSLYLKPGWVMPTNEYVSGTNTANKPISAIYSASLRFEHQTDGSKGWHQMYNYPSYGMGIYFAKFSVPNQLGNPISLYGFLSSTLYRHGRFALKTDFSLGLAFNWEHFSSSNTLNVAMGGPLSCYIDAAIVAYYNMCNHFDLGMGLALSHFSNGALKKPNKGINVLSPKLVFKYKPYDNIRLKITEKPRSESYFENLTTFFFGVHDVQTVINPKKENESYENHSYLVFGLDDKFLRRFNLKHSLGLGIGIGYNQYVGTEYRIENDKMVFSEIPVMQRFHLSAYISYEYRIHRLAILLEPGIYIYKNESDKSENFFQRIGFRHYLSDSFFYGVSLRAAYFSVAQYIEWTIGYRINGIGR